MGNEKTLDLTSGTKEGVFVYGVSDSGLDNLIKTLNLDFSEERVKSAVTAGLLRGAEIISNAQRKLAPPNVMPTRSKGTIRKSISVGRVFKKENGEYGVRIGIVFKDKPEAIHAIYQEFGRVGGVSKKGKKVRRMQARPFIRPAFAAKKEEASEETVKSFKEVIDKW